MQSSNNIPLSDDQIAGRDWDIQCCLCEDCCDHLVCDEHGIVPCTEAGEFTTSISGAETQWLCCLCRPGKGSEDEESENLKCSCVEGEICEVCGGLLDPEDVVRNLEDAHSSQMQLLEERGWYEDAPQNEDDPDTIMEDVSDAPVYSPAGSDAMDWEPTC